MYNTSNANATLRIISYQYGTCPNSSYNNYFYQYFGAYASSTDYPRNGSNNYYGMPYYIWDRGAFANSQGSTAWFRFDYYGCSYVDYYKVFQYVKTENLESETNPTGQANVSNVQEWVQYREK